VLAVELYPIQNSLILRARGVELLILSHHIVELKARKDTKEFADYFLKQAMVNRSARKLFEAWLRKDTTLWRRIYHSVMHDFEENKEETTEANAAAEKA
jgi:MarR-like DNA-binding transcriptional regulator SgrR of sgrS sRNA